ncbi:formimidoylglutamase [Flavobacterium sp.]|uniref:formimidoylglutamase n=1 Tax=Flavobacterium sp. TaxID=239 RepID=UPI003528E221
MMYDFLQPVNSEIVSQIQKQSKQALGNKVVFHTETDFPNLDGVEMAILAVNDYRGAGLTNDDEDFSKFRTYFYALFPGNWTVSIADLGTIQAGATIEDTYFLVKSICSELLRKKIIPVIIGGSQDLTYALYRSYDNLDQMVNLVSVDSKFDFAQESGLPFNSYLTKIVIEEPNNLFNYSNLGYQTYFNSQEEIDLIEKLYFDAYRLGEVSQKLYITEPVFRDADIASFDMMSVESSNSGNINYFNPNGFSGKEICALARYAGISDKISSFGVFNFYNSTKEVTLVAQTLWYFIEGYANRYNEYPFTVKENYYKYIVPIDDEELVFYKSNKTDRWWIEIPIFSNIDNKIKRNTLLPCTHQEYLAACEQEIPERWWKIQRRNLL